MLISEAKGKLKVGDRVRTNGNDSTITDFFEGEIVKIGSGRIYIKRNDKSFDWCVNFESPGTIDILPKRGRHIPRSELKVGMVVVCGNDGYQASWCWNDKNEKVVPFRIIEINNGRITRETLDGLPSRNGIGHYCDCSDLDHLYLWEEEVPTAENPSSSYWYSAEAKYTNQPKKTIMTNVIELFRKLTLSNEDKLMTELGLENPAGTPTQDGIQILLETVYAERRADIIKKAELIKAAMEEGKK